MKPAKPKKLKLFRATCVFAQLPKKLQKDRRSGVSSSATNRQKSRVFSPSIFRAGRFRCEQIFDLSDLFERGFFAEFDHLIAFGYFVRPDMRDLRFDDNIGAVML